MSPWPNKALGELCDVRIGRTPRRDNPRFWGKGATWITVGELNGGTITSSKEEISNVAVRECMPAPVPAGTLLFSFKLSIGKMAVAGIPLYTNEAIAALPIRDTRVLSREFLHYALLHESHDGNANTAVMGKVLNKEQVRAIRVPVPPLAEQERIVRLLDEADTLRKLRAKADRRTAAIISALFHEMFGDPTATPLRWPTRPIGELASVQTGRTPGRDTPTHFGGAIPWVKTTEVNGGIIYDTEEKLTQNGFDAVNGRLFPVGSVVIAMYGQGKTRGQSAVLGVESFCNQACAIIRPSEHFHHAFLFALLQLSYGRLRSLARGGNQQNLNLDIVRSFTVPCPPLVLQEEFARQVERVGELEAEQAFSQHRLDALFQSTLHRAFAGDL